MTYRGRFAPSPTGPLHFGSLVAAVGSYLRARSQHGAWIVRMEDLDPPREVPGAATDILETLAAFGMESDEPVLYQSTRESTYSAAFHRLREADRVFPCWCSRADLETQSGLHRGVCTAPADPVRAHAWRLRAPDTTIGFDDLAFGAQAQNLRKTVGDFVLRRVEGWYAYQLAVVTDDANQGITEVVRGADLLDSTPRQIYLQRLLGLPTPAYLHLPLVLDAAGRKLSKRDRAHPPGNLCTSVASEDRLHEYGAQKPEHTYTYVRISSTGFVQDVERSSLCRGFLDRTDPLTALRMALRLLGQRVPKANDVAALLSKAATDFDLAALRAVASAPKCKIDPDFA